ncbi:MAG TPA: hypothetical protein VGH99_02815 [Pseudonocardia sp.]
MTDRVRPRYPDPTLGVVVPGAAPTPATHPLVTVGDSLVHGMSGGAVFDTALSWPSVVAGVLRADFPVPSYGGPLGGLPFNIEGLLRGLQDKFGERLNPLELVALPLALQRLVDANEDYWERGDGSRAPSTAVRFANVGIYGWDVRDCLSYTAGLAATRLAASPPHDDLLGAVPSNDSDIAARSVLAPFGPSAAQIDAAAWFGDNGGIGTLIVAHGANNALRTVVDKQVRWSDTGYDTLDGKGAYNVWRPTHFALEYGRLVDAIRAVSADRVVLATVPHVTVAPIAQGVNPDRPGQKWRDGSRYFPYYTDPWIAEADFRPEKHRHLTHQQARAVDSAVDQYNATIADSVSHARSEGRDWYLFDMCGILDGLAQRRYVDDDEAARRNGWTPYPLPAELADLDTRFFRSDRTGRLQGGLFGLDGVHPTTSGYAVLAGAVRDVLAVAGLKPDDVDYVDLRRRDTLNAKPPALMTTVLNLITPFLTRLVSR